METKHTASTPPREELHPRLPCTPPCINKTLHSVTSSSEIDNQGRGASTPPLTGEKRGRDFSDGDNESRFVSRVRIDNATSLSSAVLVADTERPERTTNFQKNLSSQQEVEGSKPVGLPLDKQGDDMDDSDDEVYYEVEEYQAAEQQLFAEGASLQIDTGGDHISPEQDDYCISPGWELALGEFDLDACTGSKPMPYKTFSFFMRHEITRISLALGLTPQECSTRVPAVAEQYGHKLHSARTRRKMWEILGALGSDISAAGSNKALPAPPTEEVWSTVKDSKLWSDKIELTGVASFNQSSSNSSGSSPTISLNPPTLSGKMNKFTRSFGSDRFLTLRIPLPNSGASGEAPSLEIARWLAEDELTLMGRRWRCFWAKPGSKKQDKKQDKQLQPAQPGACKQWVQAEYYLRASFFAEGGIGLGETSKDEWSLAPIEGTCRPTIRREMGREDLIRWHIPIDKHMDTPFPKMWSRISLGIVYLLHSFEVLSLHRSSSHSQLQSK
jgi:hypothetical protein